MTHTNSCWNLALTGAALFLVGSMNDAQIFVRNTVDIPVTPVPGNCENVDFGDVDLDGDWDVVFARGGDVGDLQDLIWINQGGLQGGSVGNLVDQTASRFPVQARTGRDIEFVDLDGDSDLDLHLSNTATHSNQGNRWWINDGNLQGGTKGFYSDETATHWSGLNSPSSSIPTSLLLPNSVNPETFIDWSCDSDFGDLDNDGDMDLVHSTYGSSFSGQVPTRIFLNDGSGVYSEFNPSGFKLPGQNISSGDPGLWCEGMQQTNTTDSTGSNCDIATSTLDIDIGDFNGDYDLDILHGDRLQAPRFFSNRLAETGGLVFRDTTGSVFPPGYQGGTGHYEQEAGDFDCDGDLDIYGLDWQAGGFSALDVVMENDGTGDFVAPQTLTGSTLEGREGDLLDYDNDGDLDIYIASFSGNDQIYRNDDQCSGSSGFSFSLISEATSGLDSHAISGYISLDADACDLDGDGDYDVISAQDNNNANVYWENTSNTPDTSAPYLPKMERLIDRIAGTSGIADIPVRVHVYDNAPYYITWYNKTTLNFGVDGLLLDSSPAVSSGGQVFRAEIPSNLVGQVVYRFDSEDEYGNVGSSAIDLYDSTSVLDFTNQYGFGSIGASGTIPNLSAKSIATPGKTLYMTLETPAGPTIWYMLITDAATASSVPISGAGFLNVTGTILQQKVGVTDFNGLQVRKFNLAATVPTGFDLFFQAFTFDGQGGDTYASTRGVRVSILP